MLAVEVPEDLRKEFDPAECWATWTVPFDRDSGITCLASAYHLSPAVRAHWEKRAGGAVLWYDFTWDNPRNRDVRGVPLARVAFHFFPAYEPWCRDHGPIFLVREQGGVHERAVVDWGYNAWGGKYPPFDLDDAVPQHVARLRGLPLFSPVIVMEGGALEVNGRGTVLTTESCLLNPNRNPHLSKAQIEQYLRDFLGVTNVLWLGDGIVGDDTDGHVDDLTRFVNPTTAVTVVEDDPVAAFARRNPADRRGQLPPRLVVGDLGLPDLIGSQRQVAWATTIRAEKLAVLRTASPDSIERLTMMTDAKWWIDRRGEKPAALAKD